MIRRHPNITGHDYRTNAFCRLIRERNIQTFLEVGVRDANFAKELLEFSELPHLYGIDIKTSDGIKQLEEKEPVRYKFILGTSPQCAALFKDNSLDCVYLDDDHSEEQLSLELPVWYTKIKIGGILAGHDYMKYYCQGEGQFGVMQAVEKFCKQYSIQFYVTGCPHTDLNKIHEYGVYQGQELTKKDLGQAHNFFDVPNWWFVKEKELNG